MNMRRLDREWLLSGLLLLVGIVVLLAVLPVRVEPVLKLQFVKSRVPITQLHQRRSVEGRQTVWVDHLDLSRNGQLAHATLGVVGYSEHFFLDLDRRVDVVETGSYRFVVASDDGFALYVDDAELCSFTGERALATQTCTAALAAGERRFRLRYFQGSGPAGLTFQYGRQGEAALYWFGESSRHFRFTTRSDG
ncbi:MAG: PA14 domain-containing protein [Pseudomarimonas sp.]